MYERIWRMLPGGRPIKIVCSVVLAAGIIALLWFVVFPWLDALLVTSDPVVTP